MVWGCFSFYGKSQLKIVNGHQDSPTYVSTLISHLAPFVGDKHPSSFTFQQDNAPTHTSKLTQNWLNVNQIDILDWPPYSPDLNPIENLWEFMTQKMYKNGRHLRNLVELQEELEHIWDSIEDSLLHSLAQSMPSRLQSVLALNGGGTRYQVFLVLFLFNFFVCVAILLPFCLNRNG